MSEICKKLSVILFLLILMPFTLVAEETKQSGKYDKLSESNIAYKTEIPGMVVINNKENHLYKQFCDSKIALNYFAKSNSDLLDEIQLNSKLDPIYEGNIDEYIAGYYELLNADKHPDWFYEGCDESLEFLAFIDIFENKNKNDRIIDTLNSENESKYEELYFLLPYNNPFVEDNRLYNSMSVSGFSITNGSTYASNYAVIPNVGSYHYYINGDCANFASQILEAGGVAQNDTGSFSSGWWYHQLAGTDQCSYSWRLADDFCDYYGMYYTSTNHKNFSQHLRRGSFIAYDETADGDWDHVGYVTLRSTSYSSSLGYYDYMVAQHSNNYNAWTSSTNNGWENLEDGTCLYGIIVY